ncbi:MAG: hypothetical protein B7X76_06125, partial [Azorhizobium sp. 39-67-5]
MEAHSGYGAMFDDPRHVSKKMRGPTPPNVYNLRMREALFHGVEAIRKVDFELYEGETLAIVGPSGCGKSTLFNIISGLLDPTRGHVEVGGRRVEQATGHVGYMLQKDLLLP